METTGQKDRLRTIIQKVISGNREWLKEKVIYVGDKGDYWVLNYGPGERNEYNELVRGIVIQKPLLNWTGDVLSLIKSFSFLRFYNKNEKEAASVDFSTAVMLEKLDGSLVCVWFPYGDPKRQEYNTRKMISSHLPDLAINVDSFHGKKFPFMKLIGEYVSKLNFFTEDVKFTYVFEFIHEASKVLTSYTPEQYGLYLIGARNLIDHRELTENELDNVAVTIGAKRPRRWQPYEDEGKIRELMDEIDKGTKDFEGFVFRDKEGKRIKLKRMEYVKLHHLIGKLSFKNLIPKILDGEEFEIINYFPSAKIKIDEFKKVFDAYIDNATSVIMQYHHEGLDRKSLALKIFGNEGLKDQFLKSLIMNNFQNGDEDQVRQSVIKALKDIALGIHGKDGSPKRLMEILGMKDDEEEETADVGEI